MGEFNPKNFIMPGDLDKIQHELKQLTNRIDTVTESVELRNTCITDMDEDVKTILLLLQGNELNKEDKGLVGIVFDLKARVTRLEKWKDRAVAIIIGFSIGAGYALSDIINRLAK